MEILLRFVCKNFESPAMSNTLRILEILSAGPVLVLEQNSESSQLYSQRVEVHQPYLREWLKIPGERQVFPRRNNERE
jgi:hypothetical protein